MQPEQTPVSRGYQLCLGEFSGLGLSSTDLSVAQDCGIHAYSILLKSYIFVLGSLVVSDSPVPQCFAYPQEFLNIELLYGLDVSSTLAHVLHTWPLGGDAIW